MPPQFRSPDEIIRGGLESIAALAPFEGRPDAKERLLKVTSYDGYVDALKTEGKLDEETSHLVGGATLYGLLEKAGIDPNEWQLTVKPIERGNVKYGPDEYEEARKFLGSWTAVAETALFAASIASIVVAIGGTILSAIGLASLKTAIRTGVTETAISNLLSVAKLRGIKWLSIPALVAAVGTAWSWFANVQLTASGDLETYIKQGVARGEEAKAKLAEQQRKEELGLLGSLRDQPKIIIRMAETSKPQLFTGILFAAPLSKPEAFDRVLDDEITDLADLQNDLKLNLAGWVKGLAGRISVALSVRNNPIISQSEKLSGTWLVASLSYGLVDGGRVFLDTIPLGPINPVKYMPKVSEVKTLENQIFGEFKPESVKELVIPPSALQALTKEGEIVSILPTPAAGVAGTIVRPATVVAPQPAPPSGAPGAAMPAAARIMEPATPAAAVAPPPAAEKAPTERFAVDQIARVNDPEGLNVRSFAGTAGTKLFAIPIGTTVRIASSAIFKDGFEWHTIEVRTGPFIGRGGWVASEFLT